MVKIPKAPGGLRVLFRDPPGRFVAQSERYQKATMVQRRFRNRWETVITRDQPGKIGPKQLVDLLTRDEFEALAPNYGKPVLLKPKAKKFTAWDVSSQVNRTRGLRGHEVKVTMNIRDGDRLRKVTFYRKLKRKGDITYGVFAQMNRMIGNEKLHLYNRIGSKLLPDRKGKQVHLESITVEKEL